MPYSAIPRLARVLPALVLALAASGCAPRPITGTDAGLEGQGDAATDASPDAATDAGPDSGMDAGDPCGNGTCEAPYGENAVTCAADCPDACGDTLITGNEVCDGNAVDCSTFGDYAGDAAPCNGTCSGFVTTGCRRCGDATCDAADGETATSCYGDCGACGDGTCTAGPESVATCYADCGSCGDGLCTAGSESAATCYVDCGACGDAACTAPETAATCYADCGACGDGSVDGPELCDGGSVLCSTLSPTYYATDSAPCNGTCAGYVTTGCSYCGDAILDAADGEVCETGQTIACATLLGGNAAGTATCGPTCAWDTAACTHACTVEYDLAVTFQLTDSTTALVDGTFANLDGTMALRFTADATGNIVDGPVAVLFHWQRELFTVTSASGNVAFDVHSFTPSCAGATTTPGGQPASCPFVPATMTAAQATGTLTGTQITWGTCTAGQYWTATVAGGGSYEPRDAASGAGCLLGVQSVGDVDCNMTAALCDSLGLAAENNPRNATWAQPMVNGPTSSGTSANALSISADRRTVTTPTGNTTNTAPAGRSWNVPDDTASRSWSSFTGTALPTGTGGTTCLGI